MQRQRLKLLLVARMVGCLMFNITGCNKEKPVDKNTESNSELILGTENNSLQDANLYLNQSIIMHFFCCQRTTNIAKRR